MHLALPFLHRRRKPTLTKQEALAARPVRVLGAEMKPAEGGCGKLTVPLRQTRWTGWIFRMPEGSTKTFELDAVGVMVWDQCDGKTSVQQIIRKVAKRYNISVREAEVSTRQFLHMLGRKGLIGFTLKNKPGENP